MNRLSKVLLCFLLATLVFFSSNVKAQAASIGFLGDNSIITNVIMPADKCNTLFGVPEDASNVAYWLQWVLNAMKYIAIAALLVLSSLDFIKAIVESDKDALKKAGTTTAKRFVYAVLIFFLPYLVNFLMEFFGAYGTCSIG